MRSLDLLRRRRGRLRRSSRRLDVAIAGNRIVAVGNDLGSRVEVISKIDTSGLIVAPGFTDAHAHDDCAALATPDMAPKVSQGVTTVITGNCGVGLAPFADGEPPPP